MCKNFTNNWNAVKQNCQHLTIINPYCHYKIRKRNKIAHYSLYCLILMPSLSVPTLFHAKEKRIGIGFWPWKTEAQWEINFIIKKHAKFTDIVSLFSPLGRNRPPSLDGSVKTHSLCYRVH